MSLIYTLIHLEATEKNVSHAGRSLHVLIYELVLFERYADYFAVRQVRHHVIAPRVHRAAGVVSLLVES